MKSTGIVRRLDELGRIVIPIEIRNKFNITERDSIEIYVDGNNIVLSKFQVTCVFCESNKNLTEYKGKNICNSCLKKLINNANKKNKL